ncbi:acetyl-CoA carboxylase carboxyltransferase subunit alpha [Clostridium botulinum]|uniref:acetyl-CoA carboxylase carboxyltransferase subunit alpha n=1 Tax=Clostridium botulinum TaxID=1491 RepID=UPI000ABD3546
MVNIKKTAWDNVNIARNKERPSSNYYIYKISDKFVELHGDRCYGDDKAVITGVGKINEIAVCIIGISKGETISENVQRNFGMASPEGYKKSLRVMKFAENHRMPIICFIDTPGAYCGVSAEENGQGMAIANNLVKMSRLKVPIISIFIGEGGSGGALALGICDKIFMLENSIYSILSPEGFASILWKDITRVKEAAEKMRLTAKDLKQLNVIDKIVEEPNGGAHNDRYSVAMLLRSRLIDEIDELMKYDINTLLEKRYLKYRYIEQAFCNSLV